MNFKKLIFWLSLLWSISFFAVSSVYAQGVNELCSNNYRWTSPSNTYESLYNPSPLQKKYIAKFLSFTNWNATINGNLLWYNNFTSCPSGNASPTEINSWNSFRWSYIGNISPWDVSWMVSWPSGLSYNTSVSMDNVMILQRYINFSCWLPLSVDGRVGIQTLYSVKVCKPLWSNKLSWNMFANLVEQGVLFTDAAGTMPVYNTGTNDFVNAPSGTIYVNLSGTTTVNATSAPTHGLVPLVIATLPVTTPTEWDGVSPVDDTSGTPSNENSTPDTNGTPATSCFEPPSWYTFRPISFLGGWSPTDTIYDINAQNPTTCNCQWNTKKVTKTLAGEGGVVTAYTISVCEKCDPKKCNCGVKLNTNVPFIGRCIMYGNTNNTWLSWEVTTVNSVSAFPILMSAMIKLLMGVILVVCLWTIIVGWFMMTVPGQYDKGKWLVKKVVWTIVALWSLWLILYLINPNFFK